MQRDLLKRSKVSASAWTLSAAALASLAGINGCQQQAPPRPPEMGPPAVRNGTYSNRDPIKPLPDPSRGELPAPPFDDVPLVNQRPPEQKEFLRAYEAVRRPRMVVFVNRTLTGTVLPVSNDTANPQSAAVNLPSQQIIREEHIQQGDPFFGGRPYYRERHYEVRTLPPQPMEPALPPDKYDEARAKVIDYAAIEAVLTQWLSCEGQVTIASPAVVREKLTEDQITRLQQGRPRVLGEVAKELNADLIIQVQCRPTQQTERGLEVRLIAEAINVVGGESIGRATVLIPPPLDNEQVNKYTRFVARKLMSDMTMTWSGPGPEAGRGGEPSPTTPGRAPPESPPPAILPPAPAPPPASGASIPAPGNPAALPPLPAEPADERPAVPPERGVGPLRQPEAAQLPPASAPTPLPPVTEPSTAPLEK